MLRQVALMIYSTLNNISIDASYTGRQFLALDMIPGRIMLDEFYYENLMKNDCSWLLFYRIRSNMTGYGQIAWGAICPDTDK